MENDNKNKMQHNFLPNFLSAMAGEEQRLTANAAKRMGHHSESIPLLPYTVLLIHRTPPLKQHDERRLRWELLGRDSDYRNMFEEKAEEKRRG